MAVAQSEFARFVHLAREACNIKLGPSNAMLSMFRHVRVFTRALPKVTFCDVERSVLERTRVPARCCEVGAQLGERHADRYEEPHFVEGRADGVRVAACLLDRAEQLARISCPRLDLLVLATF